MEQLFIMKCNAGYLCCGLINSILKKVPANYICYTAGIKKKIAFAQIDGIEITQHLRKRYLMECWLTGNSVLELPLNGSELELIIDGKRISLVKKIDKWQHINGEKILFNAIEL